MKKYVVEHWDSDQLQKLGPTGAYFQYMGIPKVEQVDVTREAVLDETGRVRAARERWRIRRVLEPDPTLAYRLAGTYRTRQQPTLPWIARFLIIALTAAGTLAGAMIGAVVGAIAADGPGLIIGAGCGGFAFGSFVRRWLS
jgi:hypothetical protein